MTDTGNILLDVKDLTVYYGKALALDNISLRVNEGEIAPLVDESGPVIQHQGFAGVSVVSYTAAMLSQYVVLVPGF